ncbi:hypothetical protein BHE74_00046555, partial [Ensete ventricosum]
LLSTGDLPALEGLLRCGKSCRLRWKNYLRPDLRRGNFTAAGDELIIELHGLLGNKTDNEIKNYWNTTIKRKLLSRGLDPQTHRPIELITHPFATLKQQDVSMGQDCTTLAKVLNFSRDDGSSTDLNLDLSISPPYHPWRNDLGGGGSGDCLLHHGTPARVATRPLLNSRSLAQSFG